MAAISERQVGDGRLAPWKRFGCREDPFRAFDDRSLFLGHAQRDLLERLAGDLARPRGLSLITGPAGTGKTTLLRRFATEIRAQGWLVLYFATPAPIPNLVEITKAARTQAGLVDDTGAVDGDPLAAFEQLLSRLDQGQFPVLIVDEAQSSQDPLIEDLLALAVPAPQGASLLPIFLAGQPSLALRLGHAPIGAIGHRYELGPLSSAEVAAFIGFRLQQADCPDATPFTRAAIERIKGYANGVPGSINTLCRLAFFFAAEQDEDEVTVDLVELAASAAFFSVNPLTPSKVGSARTTQAESHPEASEWERLAVEQSIAEAGIPVADEVIPSQKTSSVDVAAIATNAETVRPPESGRTDFPPASAEQRRGKPQLRPEAFAWAAGIAVFVLGSVALVPLVYDSDSDFAAVVPSPLIELFNNQTQESAASGVRLSSAAREEEQMDSTAQTTQTGLQMSSERAADEQLVEYREATTPELVDDMRLDGGTHAQPTSQVPVPKSKDQESQSNSETKTEEQLTRAYTPTEPTRSVLDKAEIDRLLALGQQYVKSDRLVAPRFDNALAIYCRILRADPESSTARAGIATIKARIREHARVEEARGDVESARRQLSKLEMIDAQYQAAIGQPPTPTKDGNALGKPAPEPDPSSTQDRM
jgi:type II secretory pathway predicted ATPase ExeA